MKTVGDEMKTEVICLEPEWTLLQAKGVFEKNEISGAPVVVDGQVLGVFSLGDALRHLTSGKNGDYLVGDLMSRPAVCAAPEDRVADVIEKMLDLRIRRIIVVDSEDNLVGIVTATVLLKSYLRALAV